MRKSYLIIAFVGSLFQSVHTFTPATRLGLAKVTSNRSQQTIRSVSVSDNYDLRGEQQIQKEEELSFVLSPEEEHAIIRLNKGGKEKIINGFGMWCIFTTIVTCPVWMAAMMFLEMIYKINDEWDPDRKVFDATGKVWAKAWLSMTGSYPTFSGHVELIKEGGVDGCLFVANHASWLDIPVLCTVLDPVFKFIAKGELKGVPCIGTQLIGGHHILIDREDRRSQLKTFKEGITWLKKGVPLMAFPEGKRSQDGRLMEFKGGIFSMAVKTNKPIVPISISNTHAIMPSNALFPVQSGSGKLHVHVHAPITTEDKTEAELAAAVREALLSTLPQDQHPIEESKEKNLVLA